MRHVDIGRLPDALSRALLLDLWFGGGLLDLEGVLARRFLADIDELAVHVVDARQGHAPPHALELRLDAVVQRRVVEPDGAREVVLLGAHHQDPVLGLELGQRGLAVGPAVLEILDREARGVRLALQVRQQRLPVVHVPDHRAVLVYARPPRLLRERRVRRPGHARVAPEALRQLALVLVPVRPEAEVVDDVRHRLGVGLFLEVFHRKRHLRLDLGAVARELRLRKRHMAGRR